MGQKDATSTVEQENPDKADSSTSTPDLTAKERGDHSVSFSGEQVQELLEKHENRRKEDRNMWQEAYNQLQKLFNDQNKERDKKVKKQDKRIDKLEDRIQNSTSSSFAILCIFATVFIFISLNVNIFQDITSASDAVFFMFIIALACCFIISVPLLVLFSLSGHKFQNSSFILKVCALSIGFLLLIWIITFLNNFEIQKKTTDKPQQVEINATIEDRIN